MREKYWTEGDEKRGKDKISKNIHKILNAHHYLMIEMKNYKNNLKNNHWHNYILLNR